ncbi:type II secretion system protein GspK [Kiritimatiellaeota bacterium B1221]|nr:type II secretion system protein GspK [Kiritimatiellaeota bacterium B1221]
MIPPRHKQGSALMLALVTIVMISTLLISFIFRIRMESDLAARQRFGMKARHLSLGGQEYAKWMLLQATRVGNEADEDTPEELFVAMKNLQRGVAIHGYPVKMDEGTIQLSITPESSRRNVNSLSDPDWEQMLENSGVPDDYHAQLIAAFRDWTDEDEATRLLGAEEDDSYYQDLELPVKNDPVESLAELGMIRGFTKAILYGGTLEEYYDEPEVVVSGIAGLLTVYGNATVNINSASKEVLMSLSGIREDQVDQIIEGRSGADGEFGTDDDGYNDLNQGLAAGGLSSETSELFSLSDFNWVRVVSIGEVAGIKKGSLAIYEFTGGEITLVSYEEREL